MTKFTEMFELSCNGRWPHLTHQCYTPTVEEEIEDIKTRVAEPRHLPTLDDLILAQEEVLEPSDIRRCEHSHGIAVFSNVFRGVKANKCPRIPAMDI